MRAAKEPCVKTSSRSSVVEWARAARTSFGSTCSARRSCAARASLTAASNERSFALSAVAAAAGATAKAITATHSAIRMWLAPSKVSPTIGIRHGGLDSPIEGSP